MLQAIDAAETSITIEAYICWAGDLGLAFARAGAKVQQGVPVKILLDAVGSATIGSDILETLETGGCLLAWDNPIHCSSMRGSRSSSTTGRCCTTK